jgi:hypothetical protein
LSGVCGWVGPTQVLEHARHLCAIGVFNLMISLAG